MADPTPPAVALDPEGRELELEAAKARFRAEIAKSTREANAAATPPTLTFADAGIPSVSEAPNGVVTISEGAGSFGAALVHETLEAAARGVADKVAQALGIQQKEGNQANGQQRVLVIEDRAVRGFDVAQAQAKATLDNAKHRLEGIGEKVDNAKTDLVEAWAVFPSWPPSAPVEVTSSFLQRRMAAGSGDVPTDALEGDAQTATGATPAAAGGGPLGAALGLLGLLRTDYTLTATAASTTSAELAILVAAELAKHPCLTVQSDSLTTLPTEPPAGSVLAELNSVRATITDATRSVADLEVAMAPMDATIAGLAAAEASAEQAWQEAALSDKTPTSPPDQFFAELQEIRGGLYSRRATVATYKALAQSVKQVLAEVDSGLAGALSATPVPGGEPILLTALRGEQLRNMTNVLYVHVDDAGGDVVTRQSLLGSSGRLGFLGAGSTSWLLVETTTGNIKAGGSERHSSTMAFDIPSSTSTRPAEVATISRLADDPLVRLEWWAKAFVLALIGFLLVIGTALAVNVISGLFGDS